MNTPLSGLYYYPRRPQRKFNYWVWIFIAVIILFALISQTRGAEYPICKDFNPTEETFGEHKLMEHISGQDYIHEFNEPNWDKIIPIIIQIESNGNPNAVSKAGCKGLMQISELVLKEWNSQKSPSPILDTINNIQHIEPRFTKEALFNPDINKAIGTWYLKRIYYHYLPYYKIPQTIDIMLIAYHDGIGNLKKYIKGKRKLGKEMKLYLKKYNKLVDK